MLKGTNLVGGTGKNDRVDNDFYATPPEATHSLFTVEKFDGLVWEPACGNGLMSEVIKIYNETLSSDLIDRGYGTPNIDFLEADITQFGFLKCENIITNPPFSLFQDFTEKALNIATKKVALFGKLQALEGNKRNELWVNSPFKVIYVFKSRVNPLRNGSPVDDNGKKWCSTMAFAWFVWEKGYVGEPVIRWI
jgi:predicted RNA methylase